MRTIFVMSLCSPQKVNLRHHLERGGKGPGEFVYPRGLAVESCVCVTPNMSNKLFSIFLTLNVSNCFNKLFSTFFLWQMFTKPSGDMQLNNILFKTLWFY